MVFVFGHEIVLQLERKKSSTMHMLTRSKYNQTKSGLKTAVFYNLRKILSLVVWNSNWFISFKSYCQNINFNVTY